MSQKCDSENAHARIMSQKCDSENAHAWIMSEKCDSENAHAWIMSQKCDSENAHYIIIIIIIIKISDASLSGKNNVYKISEQHHKHLRHWKKENKR